MINTEAVDGTDEREMYVAKGSVPASLCEVCNTLGHRPAVRYVIFSLSAFAFSGGGNDPRLRRRWQWWWVGCLLLLAVAAAVATARARIRRHLKLTQFEFIFYFHSFHNVHANISRLRN